MYVNRFVGQVAFALISLMIIITIILVMFNEQEKTLIVANQNIEADSIVYEIHNLLRGAGCQENLQGRSLKEISNQLTSLKKLVGSKEGRYFFTHKYPIKSIKGIASVTGLSIDKYHVFSRGQRYFFQVVFARGFDKQTIKKEIEIFLKRYPDSQKIEMCSLSPIVDKKTFFTFGQWIYPEGQNIKVQIGNIAPTHKLNVAGGIYVEIGSRFDCRKKDTQGVMGWNTAKEVFSLCHNYKMVELYGQ